MIKPGLYYDMSIANLKTNTKTNKVMLSNNPKEILLKLLNDLNKLVGVYCHTPRPGFPSESELCNAECESTDKHESSLIYSGILSLFFFCFSCQIIYHPDDTHTTTITNLSMTQL